MKTPLPDQMRVAADWLDYNEGEESTDCKAVAEWLRQQADAKEMRKACRQAGVPVAKLRAKLRETP